MERTEILEMIERDPLLGRVAEGLESVWVNPDKTCFDEAMEGCELTMEDIEDAEARLRRFAPLIRKYFPETEDRGGIIESVLTPIPQMRKRINETHGAGLQGRLLLKQDSHLPIAGSIKARGGIYEVLKHTEDLALANGLLTTEDSYDQLASADAKAFFGRYAVHVGSTGNLGLSIGIMSAAIGYRATVHMSADAKEWKKELLRSHGVTVMEYEGDYSQAVANGRAQSDKNPFSYFVDDENSRTLFLGYAVAAKRLAVQLEELKIQIDADHPLFVYLPCGVGGAPGGVSFGLKQVYGDHVHCFFVEPTQAPCMLAGLLTGKNSGICVRDLGLTGLTHADGLAVGRPSGFVGALMKPFLSGEFTVRDGRLYDYLRDLMETENIFLEPSACAAFMGPALLEKEPETQAYLKKEGIDGKMDQAVHIAWATGGSLVPERIRGDYLHTYLD